MPRTALHSTRTVRPSRAGLGQGRKPSPSTAKISAFTCRWCGKPKPNAGDHTCRATKIALARLAELSREDG